MIMDEIFRGKIAVLNRLAIIQNYKNKNIFQFQGRKKEFYVNLVPNGKHQSAYDSRSKSAD